MGQTGRMGPRRRMGGINPVFAFGEHKFNFRLDSICPTGVGKVAGVKIDIHGERRAGGVEVSRLLQRLPPSQCYGGTSRRDG
jgi:hypothetical protein